MLTTTKITKWGNSQAIRLSKEIMAQADLQVDDVISINIINGQIIIKKAEENRPAYQPLEKLYANFPGTYDEKEIDWGKSVGAEIIDEQ